MANVVMKKCAEVILPHPEGKAETERPDVPQCIEKYVSDGQNFTFPGPLMSDKMQKDKLMRFIQNKCQDSLLHLDQPEQQFSYFFWTIMELFCKRNGRLIMAEISVLLFKGYQFMRRKLRRVVNQDWCIPLAGLLSSSAPEDLQRKAIIKMGDNFASKGWTSAAHICYMVANVELGSHPGFHLIGCDRKPESTSAAMEAIEKSEVYEYVLSLTSGIGQPEMLKFKLFYAHHLSEAGLDAQAFEYFDLIATAILKSPECIQSHPMECLVHFSEKLLKRKNEEEPEWLIKVQQLLKERKGLPSPSDKPKPSNSECQESNLSDHYELNSQYTVGEELGKGGFGSVYAGTCKADGKQVAIKIVTKRPTDKYIKLKGEDRTLPMEVGLLKILCKPPSCDKVVKLLEWFETSTTLILVLERFNPCMDLLDFLNSNQVTESMARQIMWQVVDAVDQCSERRVFHRDIKLENILINPDTMDVKLIDFGCGTLMDEFQEQKAGTWDYWPPEYFFCGPYSAIPVTVWSLGVLLFCLVFKHLPFKSDEDIIEGNLTFKSGMSQECCDLIKRCLRTDPECRPTIRDITYHDWFKEYNREDLEQYEDEW